MISSLIEKGDIVSANIIKELSSKPKNLYNLTQLDLESYVFKSDSN